MPEAGRGFRRGGRSHRGGRGFGRSSNRTPGKGKNSTTTTQKKDYRFTPNVQGKPQGATYATVKDHIVQYIQSNFKGGSDIAKSIKDLKVVDLSQEKPKRPLATAPKKDETDVEKATREITQHGYDIMFDAEYKQHIDREKDLVENLKKAYSVIFGNFCTRIMQARIEEHPDFAAKIEDNPIALLEVIKTLMHDTVRAQYPMISMTDSLRRLVNIQQAESENLLDYVKRFKQTRDVAKSHLGTDMLDTFMTHTEEYRDATSDTKKKELQAKAFESWMAYLLIRGSDQAKYGTLTKNFVSQYSLGNDQYPRTITTATDVLSNHRMDPKFYENQRRHREAQKSDKESKPATTPASLPSSFAQTTPTCYCCGKKGHTSNDCPDKNTIPRSEWYVRRAVQHFQDDPGEYRPDTQDRNTIPDDNTTISTQSTSSNNRRSGTPTQNRNDSNNNRPRSWSSHQQQQGAFQGYQHNWMKNAYSNKQTTVNFAGLKNTILLDTGSTIHTGTNQDFLTDIRVSKEPTSMSTNAGSKTLTLEGTMPGLKEKVYYDPTQIANICGFALMADQYHITYDSHKEDAFLVHTEDGTIKFERTPDRLYAFTPSTGFVKEVNDYKGMKTPEPTAASNLVSTVKENRDGFTKRQFQDAKRARSLYHKLGCPTVENMKHILRMNLIKNCPVTTEDINIAEKIFGPDVGALKGKSTRRRPTPVRDDRVEIPPELKQNHENLTYYMDIMYVNGMPMLTGIDNTPTHRNLVPLKNREATELYAGLDKTLRFYNDNDWYISEIHCDQEFRTLMDQVSDGMNVRMNYTSTSEHVPQAERNNRTIGERIRAGYHNLPYKAIPKLMLERLAMISTAQLNWFPAKGGISKYLSPHTLVTRRPLDYDKHLQVPFGAYVQANNEPNPTNTNAPHMIDAIYLRPTPNKQGGHELMDLHTGKLITRNRVIELPVTEFVIKAVEKMAADQGIKSLKLQTRHKQPLFPADWTAGVDYELENETEDENNDPDYRITTPNYNYDDELDDETAYDRIDQAEIDDILADDEPITTPVNSDDDPTEPDQPEDQPEDDDLNEDETQSITDDATEATASSTRPTRATTRPEKFVSYKSFDQMEDHERHKLEQCHNIATTPDPNIDQEYNMAMATIIARFITDINAMATNDAANFGPQYLFHKGLKKFGKSGEDAALKELTQLHTRLCFTPIDVDDMTAEEKRKAQPAIMLLSQKRDMTIKGRCVYKGSGTREWLSREDTTSPTVSQEGIMLTTTVDAKEGRDVMTADVPNAFIQADMEEGTERIIMKITGVLVDLLVQLAPDVYGPHVVYENGKKVIYLQVLKALYGMLVSALLWYKQFRKDLESIGFQFNPYDPCVANNTVYGKQHTVRFHVDDLMSSHMDKKVNDQFLKWLNDKYGKHGEVKATRGPIHEYLGMRFDFSEKGKVKVDLIDYINSMLDEFSVKFGPNDTAPTPAAENLFAAGDEDKPLDKERADEFHRFVAKGLFACKRTRPDILTAIATLCTRVKKPNEDDWKKLIRLLKYLNGTRNDKLILSADDLHVIKHWADAAFAVHPDFRSHTGGATSYGTGIPISQSRKQKLNTRSSTEAELVGADDMMSMVLWTKLFMEAQGYEITKNILYQDNKSTILLENNGKRSSSKRTRAINIRYFFVTDQIEKGNVQVEYCPTGDMIGDFFSKPLQGNLFLKMKRQIMGHAPN